MEDKTIKELAVLYRDQAEAINSNELQTSIGLFSIFIGDTPRRAWLILKDALRRTKTSKINSDLIDLFTNLIYHYGDEILTELEREGYMDISLRVLIAKSYNSLTGGIPLDEDVQIQWIPVEIVDRMQNYLASCYSKKGKKGRIPQRDLPEKMERIADHLVTFINDEVAQTILSATENNPELAVIAINRITEASGDDQNLNLVSPLFQDLCSQVRRYNNSPNRPEKFAKVQRRLEGHIRFNKKIKRLFKPIKDQEEAHTEEMKWLKAYWNQLDRIEDRASRRNGKP